jgi:hypothetical protein
MKSLIAVFTFAMLTAASAQGLAPWPTTAPLNGPDGQQIGTATQWGRTTTFRKTDGELMGTLTLDITNGTMTLRDPSGNIKETATTEANVVTVRDSTGATIRTTTKEKDGTYTVRDGNDQIIENERQDTLATR